QQLDRDLEPEPLIHERDRRERGARDRLGVETAVRALVALRELPAHVAPPAPVQRLGLVAEVAEDRVMAAGAAVRPAEEVLEHGPPVLDPRARGLALGAALDQDLAPRNVRRAKEQHPERLLAVAAGAANLLVI